ncbi:2,4-dienoyl-CoA reductase [Hahella sp. CCB-MM4]|uniref:NADH:flavin oxidoreductase/NADH oxidase family protein n=1 Tax=Hahella sp. (strain CCB-MM4) TaxID=1926491 RepID=UPI000B9C5323|nr:NADH:flavin oxidoreductase/NADH oxidase family protein [Hahella sp. CCB-MM4]OZG70737.1 2,4-dienoyl-CoA reductase [Hahella sp. CCB-MM4]
MTSNVFSSITLPNGQQIKNRLVKAAMEENLGNRSLVPDGRLVNLYSKWAQGGVGLIITGNVMVDRFAMTGPGGVALEANTELEGFKRWSESAKQNDTRVWMQINHPGRQVFKKMGGKALSASAVPLDLGKHSGLFDTPRAMTEEEIQDVIQRFITTAKKAHQAGFDGVEVHAAHGYLLNQFLSPLTNQRNDQWGGSLENRARLLLDIVRGIRKSVPESFAVAVKLNSADFQRGGFDLEDAKNVVSMLNPLGVDLIEISGGNYEAPAMQGRTADDRTLAREAYFLEFAKDIATVSQVPVMSTGGISRHETAEKVIAAGVDLAGIASALAICPELPNLWQRNSGFTPEIPRPAWKDKTMSSLAVMSTIRRYLNRWSQNKHHKSLDPLTSLIFDQFRAAKLVRRYRRTLAQAS